MNIEQHAAEIAAMYTQEELRQHVERRETVRDRRLPDYVVRVPRGADVKLGPVSAAELAEMTARGE